MASSSSSASSRNWSYDVFPSFSGDVRNTFLSHFLKELDRKLIIAFKDNDIDRSQPIYQALTQAIKDSRIAVVMFSKNYASSSSCLNELLEIVKCKEEFGQVVIPVFYRLDPLHVRRQTGVFGEIFEETCQNKTEDEIILWRRALIDVANILGYHIVTCHMSESEVIDSMVMKVEILLEHIGRVKDTSSSVTTLTGPQVFINFRGHDVCKHFVSFLAPALRTANINVFIDEDQLLGTDLADLFTMIEESEIALVIFSKNYADSDWCLDELAKIKECKDQGRLKVIPIFYNLSPSVVKELRQEFGDKFRDMKRKHLHQPQRTQRWEEALMSIPNIKGMPRAEQSDTTDYEFINAMVVGIKKLLDRMSVSGEPAREENRYGGYMAPSMAPARKTV